MSLLPNVFRSPTHRRMSGPGEPSPAWAIADIEGRTRSLWHCLTSTAGFGRLLLMRSETLGDQVKGTTT